MRVPRPSRGLGGWETWAVLGAPPLCALMTFGPALHGFGLCWDDLRAITQNQDVFGHREQGLWGRRELWRHDFWGDEIDTPESHRSYRPLTVLSFRADALRVLGSGDLDAQRRGISWRSEDEARAAVASEMHFVNVALHALCTLLVGALALVAPVLWTPTPSAGCEREGEASERRCSVFGASVAALLFAAHAVHTEAVAGLVSRADLLGGIMFAGSLVAYHAAPRAAVGIASAAALSLLGLLCKETAVLSLAYVAASEAALERRPLTGVALTALLAAMLGARASLHEGRTREWTELENHVAHEPSAWCRAMMTLHCHGRYAALLLWPAQLACDHGIGTITCQSHRWPSALAVSSYSALCALVVGSLRAWDEPVLRCILIAGLPFVPSSNVFVTVGTVLAERLLYIPSIGVCLLAGVWAERLALRLAAQQQTRARLAVALVTAGLAAHVAHAAVSCCAWRENEALFSAAVANEPASAIARYNLGTVLLGSGRDESRAVAVEHLREAVRLYPRYLVAYHNLGVVYTLLGRRSEALDALRRAQALGYVCHAVGLLGTELLAEWEESGRSTAEEAPGVREALTLLENATSTCNLPYARHALLRARAAREPASEELVLAFSALFSANERASRHDRVEISRVHGELGVLFARLGRTTEATGAFEAAVAAGPELQTLVRAAVQGWVPMYEQFGSAAQWVSETQATPALQRAQELLERARQLAPEDPAVLGNLGWVAEKRGEWGAASAWYEAALARAPGNAQLQAKLAQAAALGESVRAQPPPAPSH